MGVSGGNISFYCCSVHISTAATVVSFDPMHGAAVVPHENIVGAPVVSVDVIRLCRVFNEFTDKHLAFILIHAHHKISMRLANIK